MRQLSVGWPAAVLPDDCPTLGLSPKDQAQTTQGRYFLHVQCVAPLSGFPYSTFPFKGMDMVAPPSPALSEGASQNKGSPGGKTCLGMAARPRVQGCA